MKIFHENRILDQEQLWVIEKGKKGIIPDAILEKQLQESEKKIALAKLNLTEIHNE